VPGVDITDAELKCAIAQIAALTEPPRLEPHEVTKNMLAEFKGIPPNKADNQLRRSVRLKEMKVRKIKLDGKWTNAYSMVDSVTDSVTNVD
jgi:hypothetical protein